MTEKEEDNLCVLLLLKHLELLKQTSQLFVTSKSCHMCTSRWFFPSEGALIPRMAWLFAIVTIDHRAISSSFSRTSSAPNTTTTTKTSTRVSLSPLHVNMTSSATTSMPLPTLVYLSWAARAYRFEATVVVSGDIAETHILQKVIYLH